MEVDEMLAMISWREGVVKSLVRESES